MEGKRGEGSRRSRRGKKDRRKEENKEHKEREQKEKDKQGIPRFLRNHLSALGRSSHFNNVEILFSYGTELKKKEF